MIKIVLEPARNGVVKKVTDDNYGGAKQAVTITDVYERGDNDNRFSHIIRFFYDLCDDLSMDLGNKFERETLELDTKWGSKYKPTANKIDDRIKELETEIELLKEWKNQ